MARLWGSSDHGPGGDPSWLGGKDRDPSAQSPSGWSSDFSSQESPQPLSDFATPPSPQEEPRTRQTESMAPRFGEDGEDGEEVGPQEPTRWSSDFAEHGPGGTEGRRSSRSTMARVTGLFGSLLGMVIFAIFAFRAGMDMWWLMLVVGVPLITRGMRSLRNSQRR